MSKHYDIKLLKSTYSGQFSALTVEFLATLSVNRLCALHRKVRLARALHYNSNRRPKNCRSGDDLANILNLEAYKATILQMRAQARELSTVSKRIKPKYMNRQAVGTINRQN